MDTAHETPPPDLAAFTLPEQELRRKLVADSDRDSLAAYLSEARYIELRTLAMQADKTPARSSGPRVYLLPGIMGSRLGVPANGTVAGTGTATAAGTATTTGTADELLWIHPEKIGAGFLARLALRRGDPVRALGAMVPLYLKLKLRLELAGFDVRFHAYDWRQGLETLGAELWEQLRRDPARQIFLVAHSMGGLVSRAALALERQTTADRKIARLVLIGTPNLGSFAPVLALRGIYPAVRKVATLDPKNSPEELASRVFNTFPGLHHMLPARAIFDAFDLCDSTQWPDDGLGPRPSILRDVARVREALAPPDERFFCIAGANQETIVSLDKVAARPAKVAPQPMKTAARPAAFAYRMTCEGDSTVPIASAVLPGVPTYYVDEMHPALPANEAVAAATLDLLRQGTTARLPQNWQRKHDATRTIDEECLRAQDTQKKAWANLSLAERRALFQGLALPV